MVSLNSSSVRRLTLIVAVIFAAAIGSMASASAGTDSWYLSLNRSELNPPSYVFGIVWPILYIFMMVSAFLAHKKIFSYAIKNKYRYLITMDADLQDDPKLLTQFIKNWELDIKIIYGKRVKRKEIFFLGFLRNIFKSCTSASK